MKPTPIYLGINIDHVATLRQVRGVNYPDIVHAALLAEEGGADGITVHLREDRRHIQDADVYRLQAVIQSRLNLEMAVTNEMLAIACDVRPAFCCLVPEKRQELTTEGGLDVIAQQEKTTEAVTILRQAGIEVSLFIDPEPQQVKAAAETGAGFIEIHTGTYAEAKSMQEQQTELMRIQHAAILAKEAGLIVNAGHGLHYHNTAAIAAIPEMHELNIGHSIVARAMVTGLTQAVRDMKNIMLNARQ